MLSIKTKELFTQFLESLKEDTGLEPESCMFHQYDHRGNTTEAKALQLVNDFNFEPRKALDGDTTWVRKEADKIGKCGLTFTYFYQPEEVEEPEEAPEVFCELCQLPYDQRDMCDEGDLCLECNLKKIHQGEKEQRQLEKEYTRSRL
jgi:hypothetical protein